MVTAGGCGGDEDGHKGEMMMMPRAAAEGVVAAGREEVREKGLPVVDTPARERALVDALRDVVDHFIRAYDSGKAVSRMLEASNMVHVHQPLEDREGVGAAQLLR